jgi:hypothetical protein
VRAARLEPGAEEAAHRYVAEPPAVHTRKYSLVAFQSVPKMPSTAGRFSTPPVVWKELIEARVVILLGDRRVARAARLVERGERCPVLRRRRR